MASSKKYAVFISFRGEDTRDNFTSHLYGALTRNKIHTFIDDRLERGDEISPALLKAIQGSDLSVIIFSENYASSTWCLEELVHILECNKEHGQTVIPVFYGVDPSHVRKQNGSYADEFAKHEKRFGSENRMDKVDQWRNALTEAANHSGWDSRVTKPESKLIEKIVQDILKKLNYKLPISEVKGLVGIEWRIKKIESLLCFDSRDVRVIGIWGMGGIGKTTLAAAVFRSLHSQFESCYFLANVREESEKYGLNHLREKLISELLEEEKTNRGSPLVEYGSIEYRLRQKKVFIVVDDVNNSSQIELLVGDRDRFGYGSRIILTARNVQVLRKVADEIYGVEGLNYYEALDLLCSNAFKGNTVGTEHSVLSRRVVRYARGNPLAIKVLGSVLYSKSKEEWESTLNKLEKVPNKDIQDVLRISYGELDDEEQDIFLDIACFFKGDDEDFVKGILEGCGFFASTGIQNLIDKSLVTINKYTLNLGMTINKYTLNLGMHDLLQEMGREIVREESIKQPGDRSRLWRVEDIRQVLTRNTGSAKVEGIFLNAYEMKEMTLSPEVFSKMHNLRLLKISNSGEKPKLKFPQGLQCLPDALAYLHWDEYPLKSLPSDFSPKNIVVLEMCCSQLEQLWDGVQELGNLKEIDLSCSTQLTQIPNLSLAPNLEKVNLQRCISLNEVPSYFKDKLTSLDLSYCRNLKNLPEIPQSMEVLDLSGSAIQELPSSIWSLHKLRTFDLNGCEYIKDIPPCSASMQNSLKFLSLSNCTSLTEFHELPRNIRKLNLSNTAIEVIPSSIQCLWGLVYLYLTDCKRLKSLPTSICKLKSLAEIQLSRCSQLESFPIILEPMESLYDLRLDGTAIKRLHSSIWSLHKLSTFDLHGCEYIKGIPPCSASMQNSLKFLSLSNCTSLTEFHELPRNITKLNLSNTAIEVIPSSIQCLSGIFCLYLQDCKRLKSLPTSICKLKSLAKISLSRCSQLESFPIILEPMESLVSLWLDGTAIKRLHSSIIEYLFNLETLSLASCKNLEFVPIRISHLSKLSYLSFKGCSKLERLPPLYCDRPYLFPLQPYQRDWDVSDCIWLASLTTMDLSGTNIEKLPKSIELLSLKKLALRNCKRLKSLPKLPSVLQLFADDCTSLETVSSSRTELIRDWEGGGMRVIGERDEVVNFFNCLNLDQTAKRNIMADAEIRIRRKAALAKEYFNKNEGHLYEKGSVVRVCCPGSEIPKWFMYQTAGTSVNIKLPLHWFNNFLGFALCIVANFGGDDEDDDDDEDDGFIETRYLKYETRFKTSNGGESHRFDSFIKDWGGKRKVNSDHVFQWYDVRSSRSTDSLHNYDDITEVEFYFYTHVFICGVDTHGSFCTVKHCGIRLLYEQDAENAISTNQDKQQEEEEEREEQPYPKK